MRKKVLDLANTELANEFDKIVNNIKKCRKETVKKEEIPKNS